MSFLSHPFGMSELISGVDAQRNTPQDSAFCCEPLFVRSSFILYGVSQHGQPSHSCIAVIDVSDSKRSKLKRTCGVYLISFEFHWRIAIVEFASFCQVYLDKPVWLFSPELHEVTHMSYFHMKPQKVDYFGPWLSVSQDIYFSKICLNPWKPYCKRKI